MYDKIKAVRGVGGKSAAKRCYWPPTGPVVNLLGVFSRVLIFGIHFCRKYADNRIGMFSKESIRLLFQLIQTWQVVVVTVVLVLYVFLVNYVARSYHTPLFVSKSKPQKARTKTKAKTAKTVKAKPVNSNEELGLEEA